MQKLHVLLYKLRMTYLGSPVPRLSLHTRTKNRKKRGEPGKIYHMRNVIGRENLITCGWTNEFAHALLTWIYSFSCESFYMADRTELDSTTVHYLAVRLAMVSIHRPVHWKITLTYSLTWQTGCCTRKWLLRRYKMPRWPFSKLCSSVLCAYCLNKLPERGPTKTWLCAPSITQWDIQVWAHQRSAYTH